MNIIKKKINEWISEHYIYAPKIELNIEEYWDIDDDEIYKEDETARLNVDVDTLYKYFLSITIIPNKRYSKKEFEQLNECAQKEAELILSENKLVTIDYSEYFKGGLHYIVSNHYEKWSIIPAAFIEPKVKL